MQSSTAHFPLETQCGGIRSDGDPYVLHVPLPALVPEKLNSGHQQIVVVGTISYNDGFPGTTTQVWRFCELAAWNPNSKEVQWMPCDSALYLSQIMIDDHYPKDEYR